MINVHNLHSSYNAHHILKFYTLEKLWEIVREASKKFYPIYSFWCGPIAFISILHPDDIEV